MTNTTNTPDLRAALIEARDWFESQAKAVSKGCGSSYELHDLRVQRDALDAALATPVQSAAQPATQAQDDAVAQAAADEREETKELRVALDFLAGLHPHLTIDGPPMAVAERIFDAVMGEQAELKARLASYERNMESLRAHLAKHTRQGTNNAG